MNLRWHVAQFFEIRWWQRYLGKRDPAAYLDWKRQYWRDFLAQSGLLVPPGARVLDAGCGPAGIFTVLEEQEVDAVDPLLHRYEKNLPHFRPAEHPNVHFINALLEKFFPDRQYDFIFCLNALNHVASLQQSLGRLAALTAPGGTLAVSVDAHNHTLFKRLFRTMPGDILHPHQLDLEEYRALLAAPGWMVQPPVLLKKGFFFNYYLLLAQKVHPGDPATAG